MNENDVITLTNKELLHRYKQIVQQEETLKNEALKRLNDGMMTSEEITEICNILKNYIINSMNSIKTKERGN